MPASPHELWKIFEDYVGVDMLQSKYVPEFVIKEITEPSQVSRAEGGYMVATFKYVMVEDEEACEASSAAQVGCSEIPCMCWSPGTPPRHYRAAQTCGAVGGTMQ